MNQTTTQCAIWPGFPATEDTTTADSMRDVTGLMSDRTDGWYAITLEAREEVAGLDNLAKARLTTWLVDQRLQGDEHPLITTGVVAAAIARRRLSVDERAMRLLRYLVNESDTLGKELRLSPAPLLAWTESWDASEVQELGRYLEYRDWITVTYSTRAQLRAAVTVDGHRQSADQATNVRSAQAFVAMWFEDIMDSAYSQGIEPAVRGAGFEPLRIDRKEHLNKIDDEIVAEIRRSRFIVADFTQGDDGARGGVYYEAGFAHGLGIPVILTCREDCLEKVHFDTNHYSHVVWTDPNDLREKLGSRIRAVIGEGPELHRA